MLNGDIMGTWFCPGPPNWECQELDVQGGYSNIKQCCDYCNNCQPSTGTSTWKCNSLAEVCSLELGSNGFSAKYLCDRVCGDGGVGNGGMCNDPLSIGCSFGIPNTYLLGLIGAGLFMTMKGRRL